MSAEHPSVDITKKIRDIEFKNIVQKLKDGKTLSAHESRLAAEYAADRNDAQADAQAGMGLQQVDVNTLARLCGLTTVRIHQLVKLGVIKKVARGKYDLVSSVSGYIRYLQEIIDKRGVGPEGDEFLKLKTRLMAARAESAEIELELMRGDAHNSELVREYVGGMITNAKTKALALPTKGAAQTEGLTMVQREAVLRDLIEEVLSALSQFNPSEITDRYIANRRLVSGSCEDVGAAPEADAESVG